MIAPARRAAYAALYDITRGRSDMDAAIDQARRHISDVRDEALLHELVTGTLRWRGAIDAVLGPLCRIPLSRLDIEILTTLRIGAYQLLFLDRVPPSAVVDDAVALARAAKKSSATGLVNAVLRKVASGGRPPVGTTGDDAEQLAATASHPAWLIRRWLARRSRADVESWLAFNNAPPPMTLRVNPLVASSRQDVADALAAAGVVTRECRFAPWGLVVVEGNPVGTPPFESGACLIQDEGSQLAGLMAPVRPGARVLDLCAAPGGKTLIYAHAAGLAGRVVAADIRGRRVRLLAETMARGHARVGVVHVDEFAAVPFSPVFDVVAVDAPCSGLGTVRRDPDIKWRRQPEDLSGFAERQLALLERASAVVRRGGHLIYTTCSSEPDENRDVVERFLVRAPEFSVRPAGAGDELSRFTDTNGYFVTDPVRDGLECYFGAVLVRRGVGDGPEAVVQ